jgi:hypothetical protein
LVADDQGTARSDVGRGREEQEVVLAPMVPFGVIIREIFS